MKIFDLELLEEGYYKDYRPNLNPAIANGFATAAYRFGHSMVQSFMLRWLPNADKLQFGKTLNEKLPISESDK